MIVETSNKYVGTLKNGGSGLPLSNCFYLDCLKALSGVGEEAALVLDDGGHVLFSNNTGAAMFRSTADQLAGRHVSEFVPDTRLNAISPGSNVAYAAYTGRRNQWREYCVLDATGESFPVELLFDVLVVDLRYLIMLWVRSPARQDSFSSRPSRKAQAVSHAASGDTPLLV